MPARPPRRGATKASWDANYGDLHPEMAADLRELRDELSGGRTALDRDAAAAEHGALLWPLAAQHTSRGKLMAPRDAERALGSPDPDALTQACHAIQRWCWIRGMPPLDRAIAHPRTQGHIREAADYDVYFEAIARDVHSERYALAYPWTKVKPPSPQDLTWATHTLATHAKALRAFRYLDLEAELREADAARGRTRPTPNGYPNWDAAMTERERITRELEGRGIHPQDLRPPGTAPYPPPAGKDSSWEH